MSAEEVPKDQRRENLNRAAEALRSAASKVRADDLDRAADELRSTARKVRATAQTAEENRLADALEKRAADLEENPHAPPSPHRPQPLTSRRRAMTTSKLRTARLAADQADELTLIARADGISASAAISEAVQKHVTERKANQGLPESLHQPLLSRMLTASLPTKLAKELDQVARDDGVDVSSAMREAIRKHIAARKADPSVPLRLREALERDQALADRMCRLS